MTVKKAKYRCFRNLSDVSLTFSPGVNVLWGANARSKKALITNPLHVKLETVHPSPLSAYNGFFGCRHFSKANAILEAAGETGIDWNVV